MKGETKMDAKELQELIIELVGRIRSVEKLRLIYRLVNRLFCR